MENDGLSFEEINIGDEIPPLVNKVTLIQMVMYAAATWDFHRHHYDKEFAQTKGFPGPFVDGQMFGALLTKMITLWAGPYGVLKMLRLTYRAMVFPEDLITCRGKVTKKFMEGGENLIGCELWIENQKGERVVVPVNALLALPSKNSNKNKSPGNEI